MPQSSSVSCGVGGHKASTFTKGVTVGCFSAVVSTLILVKLAAPYVVVDWRQQTHKYHHQLSPRGHALEPREAEGLARTNRGDIESPTPEEAISTQERALAGQTDKPVVVTKQALTNTLAPKFTTLPNPSVTPPEEQPTSRLITSRPKPSSGGDGVRARDKWETMDRATLIDTIAHVMAQPPPVPADPQCQPPELTEPTCKTSEQSTHTALASIAWQRVMVALHSEHTHMHTFTRARTHTHTHTHTHA
jgi:hypothetical protein